MKLGVMFDPEIDGCRATCLALAALGLLLTLSDQRRGTAAEPELADLERAYASGIRPVIARYCGDCHGEKHAEAEINLVSVATFADVRQDIRTWQKVAEMLDSGQMPPPDADQPADDERALLRNWVRRFLKAEAKRFAGDPGPVVLRRLSRAEYGYVVQDLTGVGSLDPAREFPVDGAAGEGFTNAGNALAMSPSLLTKYLDASKEIAAHAVLLPDGLRFSPATTRRDWTEEILAEIRDFYREFTDPQGGSQVNLQGIVFDTNVGGRLPVEKYLAALLAEREALQGGKTTAAAIARERMLSVKYLSSLWQMLNAAPSEEHAESRSKRTAKSHQAAAGNGEAAATSLLLDMLRQRWSSAKGEDAHVLASDIARWQQALWRFSSVGHIGKIGGPKAWMEPVNPVAVRQELRFKIPESPGAEFVTLYLTTSDAGDGNQQDFVVWERPRLVAPGRSELLLRDVRRVTHELTGMRARLIANVEKCLAAAAEASTQEAPVDVKPLASKYAVDTDVLAAWLEYLGIAMSDGDSKSDQDTSRQLPLMTRQITSSSGYDFIKGWVGDEALSVVANSSDQHVRIPGNMKPHSVAVHPTPKLQVVVGWLSPVSSTVRIAGQVQHAHPECGNGVVWSLELRRGNSRQRLASGTAHGPNQVQIGPVESVSVRTGDLVSLSIGPRDGNHVCDLTAIDMTLNDATREWNLAQDIAPDILAGNPHADRQGHSGVWHFYAEPATGSSGDVIPANSLLTRWQRTAKPEERQRLAGELQKLLQHGPTDLPQDSPDAVLYRQLTSLGGALFSRTLQATSSRTAAESLPTDVNDIGLDPARFGTHPQRESGARSTDGASASDPERLRVEAANLCVQSPSVIEVRIPAELAAGAEFLATASLHSPTGREGSVQVHVATERPEMASGLYPTAVTEQNANGPWTANNRRVSHAMPILVSEGSAAHRRVEQALDDFRKWFPAALCYTKIVPVDEVVTLTLYYREDDQLQRLMLTDEQALKLDRLWNELHFVSHDAVRLVDALEQLIEFATQDADPKVFEPLRQPFNERAAAFRQSLIDAEPSHVDAVLEFASRAYRRPLRDTEASQLRNLYRSLREQELGHDESIRLLLVRVLVSPAFLYRAEVVEWDQQTSARVDATASKAQPRSDEFPRVARVSDWELATRLSFFLWSTVPDAELRQAAAANSLRQPESLSHQTRRLIRDTKIRRLATEFMCQWLHIYEFDTHDEKSETAFPEFEVLRGPMYEEAIRFFADLFQRDGSILELLDADHTFANAELAKHYGLPAGEAAWHRVDGVKQHGRGGILGMASILSKQSGASRTSPILRGNWVSEVLLREKLPKPPKGVPQLPDVVPSGLTERQLIEQHSSVAACAKCHARIDPFGFALEGFDAIGRNRLGTSGTAKIDVHSKLLDGTEINGLDGLRAYLLNARRDDFIRQFCRKLLGYALGRAVELSDELLLDEIQAKLKANGYRVSVAIESIVQSRQFGYHRVSGPE